MLYSRLTMSFIESNFAFDLFNSGTLPDRDFLVEVSQEDRIKFAEAQPTYAHVHGADETGFPMWVLPVESAEEKERIARSKRDSFLLATDIMVSIPDYPIGDAGNSKTEILEARALFRDWPSQEGWPNIDAPKLEPWLLHLAIKNGYKVI